MSTHLSKAGLELEDIQGLVLFAYASTRDACYLHVSFGEGSHPNAWLGSIAEDLTTSNRKVARGEERVNVGLTAAGLTRCGLDDTELASFPREYRHGMAHPLRARVLGDVGESAPDKWAFGGPAQKELHALLLLYAKDETALAALRAVHVDRIVSHGGEVIHEDRARLDDHEPFGFRDGLEQPHVAGSPRERPAHATELPAGEFILGHVNAYGELPPPPRGRGGFDLGKNGTYLVYRKLSQDVAGFWQTMLDRASPKDDPKAAIALASRIVGRWPSGAPVVHHEDSDPGPGGFRQDFGFHHEDKDGMRCPIGAHIRRANPRDSLSPSPEASLKAVARHRLVRRGRVYGARTPSGIRERAERDGEDRGLIFIALNASIRRQFEFIQQTWIHNPKFGGLYDEGDPLVGTFREQDRFTLPASPARRRVELPRFITVRGGGYFFVPGKRALRWLGQR